MKVGLDAGLIGPELFALLLLTALVDYGHDRAVDRLLRRPRCLETRQRQPPGRLAINLWRRVPGAEHLVSNSRVEGLSVR